MLFSDEAVQLLFPGSGEVCFGPGEIHQLLSLFEAEEPPVTSTSGSDSGRQVYSVAERKRRRMISNRESARRCRMRKKRRLEDITAEMNRLTLENRELKNRLGLITHQCLLEQSECLWLQTESSQLQQSLSGLCQVLIAMQQLQ